LLQETNSHLIFEDLPSETSFQSEFHLLSPSLIGNLIPAGGVDAINDTRNPPQFPDEQHPLRIGRDLLIQGWFADGADGRAFDSVFAVVNDKRLVRGVTQARQDVSAFYKNPNLDPSGFRIQIAADSLGAGIQKIDLIAAKDQKKSLFRFGKSIYVESK